MFYFSRCGLVSSQESIYFFVAWYICLKNCPKSVSSSLSLWNFWSMGRSIWDIFLKFYFFSFWQVFSLKIFRISDEKNPNIPKNQNFNNLFQIYLPMDPYFHMLTFARISQKMAQLKKLKRESNVHVHHFNT